MARLTDRQRAGMAQRWAAIAEWRGCRDRLGDAADVHAAYAVWAADEAQRSRRDRPIGWSTMWRWERAVADSGPAALAARHWGRQATEPDPRAWGVFKGLLLDQRHRRKRMDAWRQTAEEARRHGWAWISYKAAIRRIDAEVPQSAWTLATEGETAYRDRYSPYVQRDPASVPVNGLWVSDHHQLDIAAVNPVNGSLGFPWVTAWMDWRSRRIVGRQFSFGPDSDTILFSFRRAALAVGLPDAIYTDRGRDYRCRQVAGGCRRLRVEPDQPRVRSAMSLLDVEPHFALPYQAQVKHIERWFRTLGEQFARQWMTYRGRKPEDRPEGFDKVFRQGIDSGLAPTLEQLAEAWDSYVEHDYGDAAHSGFRMDGRSPNEVFAAGLAERGSVRRPAEADLILCLMRKRVGREGKGYRVARNGIAPFGKDRFWFAPELMLLAGEQVYVRYDPADLERLYVFSADRDQFVCVATRKQAKGVIGADVKDEMRLKRQARRANQAIIDAGKVLLDDDPLAAVARRRQASQRAVAERAANRPTPPDGGPGSSARPNIVPFRSCLAATVEQIERLPRAAGAEGGAGVVRLPGGESVDSSTGEVLVESGSAGPPVSALFDELRESLDARSGRGGEL